ncbi:MAG: YhcN/YlaJ family sporulation lipoprotein [Paenibacillaceae bacterium]
MVKIGLRLPVIIGLAIALTGCATDNQQGIGTNTDINQQGIPNNGAGVSSQGWDNSRNNNFTDTHNNTRMEISDKIADSLTAMDEVDTATVLLTDQNAYVAVVLDNGTGYGAANLGRNVGKGNTANLGAKRTPNAMGNNATTDRMGRQGPGKGDEGLTDDLKANIAQKVKSVEPNVENVYVSANPDFVGRMRGYGERFQNGQPIRGMIIEFNTLVKRIFPTAE